LGSFEESVRSRIVPDREARQAVNSVLDALLALSRERVEQSGLHVNVVTVGSLAKDTYLSRPDLDLFFCFPVDHPRKDFKKDGLDLVRSVLPDGQEAYAQHPYIKGNYGGYDVDLVPCYDVEDPEHLITAVDRTPHHTRFVVDHLGSDQKDEVRFLKQFMKGVGVYGAEIRVQGFSGYLTELLVIRLGSFREVLEAASGWREGVHLDIPGKGSVADFSEPMVFIDPVDRSRNVASPVSNDSLNIFIRAAREYLENPRESFFFPNEPKPVSLQRFEEVLNERKLHIMGISWPTPDMLEDNLYGQLRRLSNTVGRMLKKNLIPPLDSTFSADGELLVLFELENLNTPLVITHEGPPEGHSHQQRFLSRWKNDPQAASEPYLKNGRWHVDRKGNIPARDLIRSFMADRDPHDPFFAPYFKSGSVQADEELWRDERAHILARFLKKTPPWEDTWTQ